MKKELHRYYRLLRRNLLCSKANRNRFIDQTQRMVEDFLNEKPDASYKNVEGFLGSPKSLSETFMETIDPVEIHRCKRKKRFFKIILIAFPVVAIALLCFLIYYITQMQADIEITQELTKIIYE